MQQRYILQFVCYSPKIYARLDREFVMLTHKLKNKGYTPVFVYGETMDAVPQIREDLMCAGAIVETMPERGKWNIIKFIRNLYNTYQPELVDVHFVPFVKVCTALFSRVRGIKHLTHVRSLIADSSPAEYQKKKGWIKRVLLGLNYAFLNESGKVVCISGAIARQYQEWAYGDKRNVITIYGGTDITPSKCTKVEARERLKLPTDAIIVTNISAIEYIKGIDLIIRAIAILKRKGINVVFAHIGGLRSDNQINQEYANSLRVLAKEEGVEDKIVWLGKRMDIQEILSAFDIYVHPSRSEGLGSALLEASVAGLPLIGSNVGGIADVICEGENGYLVDGETVEQLADVLSRLVEDKEQCNRMGEAAKKRADEMFNMDKQTDKLIAVYDLNVSE